MHARDRQMRRPYSAIPKPGVEALGHTRHDSLPTGRTLGREGRAVALITEKLAVLTGEGLISKGALAAAAAEAALMEVAILIEQFLRGDKAGVLAPGLDGFIFGPLPPAFTYPHPCLVWSLPLNHAR